MFALFEPARSGGPKDALLLGLFKRERSGNPGLASVRNGEWWFTVCDTALPPETFEGVAPVFWLSLFNVWVKFAARANVILDETRGEP